MNVNEAIIATVQHFRDAGKFVPTHCDVRCMINDLTQDNVRIVRNGYSQDRAFRRVRSALMRIISADDPDLRPTFEVKKHFTTESLIAWREKPIGGAS